MENKPRSSQQNRAFHKYLSQVVNVLIEHGVSLTDLQEAFRVRDISPTIHNIKDIWKYILFRKHGKITTTEMTTQDLNDCLDEFNITISELTGENIEFPSRDVQELIKYYNDQIQ